MDYPEFAEIDGVQYELNTDYRVALNCFDAIEDESLNDTTRAFAVVVLLFGKENKSTGEIENVPDNINEALRIADKYLKCGNEKTSVETHKRDMDFNYDMHYIKASFLSDYDIDLDEVKYMHYWKFCDLISGLTEQSILSKIRDLRNTDLSEYKDAKIRGKLQKAMKNVELPQKQYQATDDDIEFLKTLGIKLERREQDG